jgi:hypothetical protein
MIARVVLSLALAFALSATDTSGAEAPPHINGQSLSEVLSLAFLPVGVTTALGRTKSGMDGVADRTERFNVTDVVYSKLPMRLFIVGGVSDTHVLVAIEHGGRSLYFEAFSYTRANSIWKETRSWHLSRKPATLLELLRLIGEDAH